ncbi:ABC transporter substrate-binding protein [Dissulfurirhabdus thermomarina]|uniref:ABC transporter substrate-binding protein n=1 Tax=Dissulfurirhabdus thermomarina TaxID=1765737 RepID=A0A6N9TS83_DISTH|nr:ABC transporter substrate-binding protein [Dissulfurirhabdus thermomarina]NDY42963.1 ABC transporter substrate-binding protein [Dissulfurirhabdus thermomarina]NMX24323.1 ABC transporter substrate-binding protein [Dissulfurirhabdus thermomarina]
MSSKNRPVSRAAALLLAGLALVLSPVLPAPAAGPTPGALIRQTVDGVVAVLKQDLPRPERRARIRALVRARFDFEEMSRRVLGVNWRRLSPEEQRQFIELFTRLLEASYLDKIDTYHNETILYPKEETRGRYARVFTVIRTETKEIPVTYHLLQRGGAWWVYDVIIEGISLVSNYRASYATILKREGYDGLIRRMRTKVEELDRPSAS